MSIGYLLSSLPMLFIDKPAGISQEAFLQACEDQLSEFDTQAVRTLLAGEIVPESSHKFVRIWSNLESELLNTAAKRRISKMTANRRIFTPLQTASCDLTLERSVDAAFDTSTNPLERENLLDSARWSAVENLQGFDSLSKSAIFAYAIKLRIVLRKTARTVQCGNERLEAALPASTL